MTLQLCLRSLLLSSLVLLAAPASPAFAGTLFVDAPLATGASDGSSWADAFQGSDGLQQALAIAVAGDQIFVAQGTYKPTQGTDRKVGIRLLSDVAVYGGFVGNESSPAERPPFGSAPAILSGDLLNDDGFGMISENSFHVVKSSGVNAGALLDGFRIVGGNSNGSGNNDKGGGMLCQNGGAPVLRNCEFDGNRCTFGGGAVYVNSASPTFEDCVFRNGNGGSFGGAFDLATATNVTFERCHFEGNTAARAGALEVFSSTGVVVVNCTFRNNTATGSGGGGALWLGSGGATQVVNCTIVDNNSTTNAVGGVRVQGAPAAIVNCILWGNQGPGGAQGPGNQANAVASVSYSIVEGGNPGTGNLAGDPAFQDLAAGNYALTASSAGIDAGRNSAVPAGIAVDLALLPRFVDDPSVPDTGLGTAPLVDLGAFEWQAASFVAYCTAGSSASGCQAALSAAGTASATATSGFTLLATAVEGQKDGLFFIGSTGRQANSWGNGTSFQCVTPPVSRLGLLAGSGTSGACDGSFAQDLNALWCPACPKPAKNPGAGALVQAQLWYRDPFNTSNQTTSLSDALEFTLAP